MHRTQTAAHEPSDDNDIGYLIERCSRIVHAFLVFIKAKYSSGFLEERVGGGKYCLSVMNALDICAGECL